MANPLVLDPSAKWLDLSRNIEGHTIYTWHVFSNGARIYRDHIRGDSGKDRVYLEQIDGTRIIIDLPTRYNIPRFNDDHMFIKIDPDKHCQNTDKCWHVYNNIGELTILTLPAEAYAYYSGYFPCVPQADEQENRMKYKHWNNEYICEPDTTKYCPIIIHKGIGFSCRGGRLSDVDVEDRTTGIETINWMDWFIHGDRLVMMGFRHEYGMINNSLQLVPGCVSTILVIDIIGREMKEVYRGTLRLPTDNVRDQIRFIGMDATGLYARDSSSLFKFECSLF